MQQGLPAPPGHFSAKKSRILSQLAVPDAEYADASPKGTVDVGIRGLIDLVNEVQGLVTTSSCAGRVSVFVEGSKKAPTPAPAKDQDPDQTLDSGTDIKAAKQQVAGVGGKGAGGAWLFVSHDPVQGDDWIGALQMEGPGEDIAASLAEQRLIHFKFEPMILHILTASPAHAQLVLRAALQSGFRESGAVSLTVPSADEHPTPVVAVRSMGLGFESLIGSQIDHSESQQPRRQLLVSQAYLRTVMAVATERFAENAKRIARFQEALATLLAGPPGTPVGDGPVWEDAAARRERKRAEGLRRRAQLQKQQEAGDMDEEQAIEVANALSGL